MKRPTLKYILKSLAVLVFLLIVSFIIIAHYAVGLNGRS